jgi:transcriptional regulator with XRE-family HTH domain
MVNARRFSDQIRDAVNSSELSRYSICKSIGLNQGAFSRFMSGKSGLSMDALDRLAEHIGLEVVTRPESNQ